MADRFVQRTGNPATTIDEDDINLLMYWYRYELGDDADLWFYYTSSGENLLGGIPLGTVCPFGKVLISDEGDDRAFTEVGMAGSPFVDSFGYLYPPSAYSYRVFYDVNTDLWMMHVRRISNGKGGGGVNPPIDFATKRIVWISLVCV